MPEEMPSPVHCDTIPLQRDDRLIYDVGMHDGEDTAFYLERGYRVVGIEANPSIVARLREKFAGQIRDGRLIVVDRAIARDPGPVRFAVNRTMSVWGSLDPEFIERNSRAGAVSDFITVEAIRFADILRRYGVPYYAKIDIEGMDMACIEDLQGITELPRYVSVESTVTSGHATFERAFTELAHLWTLGYRHFKYVDQGRLELLTGTLLDREGTHVRYAHIAESSGPFGEETPGEWLSIDEAVRTMRQLILYQNTLGFGGRSAGRLWSRVGARLRRQLTGRKSHSWYDLHARFGDPA
jgi:FkbM family methyltransferase